MAFVETVAVLVCAFIILAVSLDLLLGVAGLFSAAAGIFYGIGAYAAALLWIHVTTNFVLAVVIAALASGIIAIPFVVPALRSQEVVVFVVASLAFTAIIAGVIANWQSVTGGNEGLFGIPTPTIGSLQLAPGGAVVVAGVVLALLVIAIKEMLARSGWGLDLRAAGEDVTAARSLGVEPTRLRIQGAVIACAMAGVAGVLYAAEVLYISPTGFGVNESELIAVMVVLGGAGTLFGPIVGALLLTVIPQALTFVDIPPAQLGLVEQISYGVILVLLMLLRPHGLVGNRSRIRARRTSWGSEKPAGLWHRRMVAETSASDAQDFPT